MAREIQLTLLLSAAEAAQLLNLLGQVPEDVGGEPMEAPKRGRGRPPKVEVAETPTAPAVVGPDEKTMISLLKDAAKATSLGADAVKAIMVAFGAKTPKLAEIDKGRFAELKAKVEAAMAAKAPKNGDDSLFA